MSINKRLFNLLEDKNITQADFSKAIGVSTKTISNWKIRSSDPPSELIVPICSFLDVSIEWFLTGEHKAKSIHNANNNMITDDEIELLEFYRQLNKLHKSFIKGEIAKLLMEYQEGYNKKDTEFSNEWAT